MPKKSLPSTNFEQAVLHQQVSLLEVAAPEILAELKVDKQVGKFIIKQLSDCVAVVAPGKVQLLLKVLLKAGHTPKVITALNLEGFLTPVDL